MAYSRRSYKGAPVSNALGSGGLGVNATTITLAGAMSGWATGSAPFFIVVDPGTSKEEKICVIYASSTTLTVVDPAVTSAWTASVNGRGADDTIDRAHDAGATIYPVFTATEANQANDLVSKYAVNGDIVTHGSTGLKTISTGGSGNNNKVLVADSTVSDGGVKWAAITADSLADNAVTQVKMADNSVGTAEIISASVGIDELASAVINKLVPVGTIAMYGGATAPTGWLLCDGTSTSGYTALAAIVGATTPDFKGRFALGDNASLTLLGTGGSATIGTNNLPSHLHTVSITSGGQSNDHTHNLTLATTPSGSLTTAASASGTAIVATASNESTGTTTGTSTGHTHLVSGDTGSTGGAEAYYQPHVVVNYIIKHD
jgi:microcystin-dependent protein